jgi:uncharacterized protein (DUF608 family)
MYTAGFIFATKKSSKHLQTKIREKEKCTSASHRQQVWNGNYFHFSSMGIVDVVDKDE